MVEAEAGNALLEQYQPPRFDWHAEAAEHVFLYVTPEGEGHSVWLGGPVASVFDGSIKLHKR